MAVARAKWVRGAGAGLALILAACGDRADGPPAPSGHGTAATVPKYRASARALIEQAQAGVRRRGVQDEMLQLEAEVPGFGGFYVDSASQVVAWLRRGAGTDAVAAIRQRLMERYATYGVAKVRELMRTASTAEIRDADYSLSELIAIENQIAQANGTLSGLAGVGTSIFRNRVKVGFETAGDSANGIDRLSALGIPRAAVIAEVWGKVSLTSTWTDAHRPTRGGIKIAVAGPKTSAASYGTHGYNVRRTSTGGEYFLTAAHVVAEYAAANGSVGDTVFQPTRSGGAIGVIDVNPPWPAGSTCGVPQDFCVTADVAAGRFIGGVVGQHRIGTSVNEGYLGSPGTQEINNWYPVQDTIAVEFIWQGRNVIHKSGMKTGTTTGNIDLPNVQSPGVIQWPFGSGVTRTVWYTTGVRVITGGWGPGDSGGPVFAREFSGGPYYALGLQFSGSGTQGANGNCNAGMSCAFVFTRWSAIEAQLGLGVLDPRQ